MSFKNTASKTTQIDPNEFPFEELRDKNGDYFLTVGDAKTAGFDIDQIWSVVCEDGGDDKVHSVWCYGPPRHVVNVVGYTCTKERHDHDTYFEEIIYNDDFD